MKNITKYSEFLTEGVLSSVSDFLKAQYNNIFKNPNQNLNNLFTNFTKKVDTEKNVSYLYQSFLKANQTNTQNEINKADSIDAVNNILSDSVKYFYFSLLSIVNKLQNKEFTMQEIFKTSRDKRLQTLMSYPEDQFSNAVSEYVLQAVVPQVKTGAGLDKPQATVSTTPTTPTTENVMYNIRKILEADDPATNVTTTNTTEAPAGNTDADLVAYKKAAINWINTTLFDLLKPKMQLLNTLGANTSNDIDDLSKQMKGTTNDNAKKMILNKILNMDKNELEQLANALGLKEEIGKL
jgi:hypothetical protein